jgi:hypothetical protein
VYPRDRIVKAAWAVRIESSNAKCYLAERSWRLGSVKSSSSGRVASVVVLPMIRLAPKSQCGVG